MFGIKLLATDQYMELVGPAPATRYRWVDAPTFPFTWPAQAQEVVRNQVGGGAYGPNALLVVDAQMPAEAVK
jgi:hypothetical protein